MKKKLQEYLRCRQEIYDYFRYTGKAQLVDATNQYWFLDGNVVCCSETPLTQDIINDEDYMTYDLIRFSRKEDCTLIILYDEQATMGMIFDNQKEYIDKP